MNSNDANKLLQGKDEYHVTLERDLTWNINYINMWSEGTHYDKVGEVSISPEQKQISVKCYSTSHEVLLEQLA